MPLDEFIYKYYESNAAFGREIGVSRQRVGQMIDEGWIVLSRKRGRKVRDWLYAPKRELNSNFTIKEDAQ